MKKPVAELWYAIHPECNGIVRLNEIHVDPYSVGDIWLVRGSQRDLAVDTGSGIVPPAPVIKAISDRPILAVALNSYYDHAGGWHSFANRACHTLDAADLAAPEKENSSFSDYLTNESFYATPRAGYSVADYHMVGSEPTLLLEDGDIIELGDRRLEVLHVPGRSPGGIALWEAETGSIFTSDMLYDGDHGPAWPPADPESYVSSLLRMRDLPVTNVYPGHYGKFGGTRMIELIDEQLAALNAAP